MKKLFCMMLCAFTVLLLCFAVGAAEEDYMTFKPYGIYKTAEPLDAVPATYEAWVRIPEGRTYDSGIVLGNSRSSHYHSFELHIYENGAPLIKFTTKVPDTKGTSKTYTFSNANVATGEWVHVAIACDAAKKTISCYVDGELVQTASYTFEPQLSPEPLVLGGDNISGNDDYFKGQIRSATIYSDVRTADEIKADMAAVDVADENLMAHYDLTDATFGEDIEDAAGNYDMIYDPWWYTREDVTDFAYSMAIIGDQQVVSIKYPDKLHEMYDWILANKDKHKMKYVLALGDITNDRDDVAEWTLVGQQFDRLSGILPMAICRGNHDYSEPFNKYIGFDGYTSDVVGRYEEGKLDNHYKTIRIGNTDYLFMVLDYGPNDEVLRWAGEVTAAYPNHKVIVITHGYMNDDETTTGPYDATAPTTNYGYNDGIDIWEKYVRKYENIVMVLSGHIDSDYTHATKAVGDHGNVVTQMLINPQGIDIYTPTGMVAMFYFNEEGNKITVDLYSTILSMYYGKNSRHTFVVGERNGDANGDGNVTMQDALLALSTVHGGESYKNADVDGDGKTTLYDALGIIQKVVKGE